MVAINGSFPGATAVRFGGVPASFNEFGSTRILAVVPATAVSAPIQVATPGGTATSGSDFQVSRGLVTSPRTAPPGGKVKLSGSGLPPNVTFDVTLGGHFVATGHTNGVGGFSGLVFTVPSYLLLGDQDLVVSAPGDSVSIHFLIQADWPLARFDLGSTGNNGWELGLTTGNVPGLVQKWTFTGAAPLGHSTPTVVGGIAYIAASDGHVYAVNVTSKNKLWAVQPSNGILAGAAVAGGTVYVGDGTSLFALDTATGKTLWSFPTSGTILSDPAVGGGEVLFTGWDGNAATVWDLNASNGKVIWATEVSSAGIIGSPAVSSSMVFVGDDGGHVFGLNRSTGAIVWTKNPGGAIEGHPTLGNGDVYVAATGAPKDDVWAYDQATGVKQWSKLENVNYVTPALGGGRLLLVTNSSIVALDTNNHGAPLWTYPVASVFDDTSVALANGVAYATVGGKLVAIDAATGGGLYASPTSYPGPISSPVVVNGRVYFGAQDKVLRIFGL